MPAFTGGEVPQRYAVGLNGRGYMVSREPGLYKRQSIPLQRPQQDNSAVQGEQSLNPEELWRKSFESWHKGSGQTVFDRPDSDPFRFRDSLGVDPWTKYQLGLLGGTERKLASTSTTVKLAVAGSYLYCADGQTLKYATTVTPSGVATWTTVTGTPAVAATDITSDGYTVWVAYGASGIYSTAAGAASASEYNDLQADTLTMVKGRLMAGHDRNIYNITSSNASEVRFRAASTAATASGLYKSVARPAGLREGDLLAMVVATAPWTAALPASITGFSLTYDSASLQYEPSEGRVYSNRSASAPDGAIYVYTRIAGATEPDSYTVGLSGPGSFVVAAVAYESVDRDVFYDSASYSANTVASTSAAVSSLDTNFDNDLLAYFAVAFGGVTFTPPAGMTERVDTKLASDVLSITAADKTQSSLGTSGSQTATMSGSARSLTLLLAFRAGTAPEPMFTHTASDFEWVGFAEGQGDIYAAGYSGDKSLIYKTQIKPDGTALAAPTVAGSLPDGEIIRSIYGYLGFVFLGTDKGVRMCASDANGDLTIGPLISTPAPVRCFEGQDRFVWYGLENFDVSRWASGTYDGLGRLDLSVFTSTLAPAYASDLMVTGSTSTTESVQSVVTFQNLRVLAIGDSGGASRGVYAETAIKVANGYLDSGTITYGISDTKVATYVDLRHSALVSGASVAAHLAANAGSFASVGTSSTALATKPANALNAGPTRGETHEMRVVLARASSADTAGPRLVRCTLRAEPAPLRGTLFQVPIMLFEKQTDLNETEFSMDVAAELALLEALFASQTLVTYKEMDSSYSVFVRDIQFVAERHTADRKFHQGVCLVTLKSPGA